MRATVKILSNDGEIAAFHDAANDFEGIVSRADNHDTTECFLTNLCPGTLIELTYTDTGDSDPQLNEQYRASLVEVHGSKNQAVREAMAKSKTN
jgi:hypothetical protein